MLQGIPLSVLDLAPIGEDESAVQALEATVLLARRAEELGYLRVWYAEHHNIATIASSATAVLIAHVAAHTERIRLGAGGIMLPNHAPLVIAEQFGTLATLHPGRIDLGLGRAPGTDQETLTALRRDARSAETFPQDVLELQGYLGDASEIPNVRAIPGEGTRVPLYILGSSLFGAQLAAALGLPYAFASHFAPTALRDAVQIYRERFQPSEQLDRPHVIAGVNVLAADRDAEALRQLERRRRVVARAIFSRPGLPIAEEDVDEVLRGPRGRHVDQMLAHTAAGIPDAVAAFLADFRRYADADELMTVHGADTAEGRLRSLELVAGTAGLAAA